MQEPREVQTGPLDPTFRTVLRKFTTAAVTAAVLAGSIFTTTAAHADDTTVTNESTQSQTEATEAEAVTPEPVTDDSTPAESPAQGVAEDAAPQMMSAPAAAPAALVSGGNSQTTRVGVVGPSGINWDWVPSAYGPSNPTNKERWGDDGEYRGNDVYVLQWFQNYTNAPMTITSKSVTSITGGYGTADLSNCATPMTIPANGYAVCEMKYTFTTRDSEDVFMNVSFFNSTTSKNLTSSIWLVYSGTTDPTDPTDPPEPPKPPTKQYFWDVPKSSKFFKEIQWMKTSKLSTGYADGSYRPTANLSREAMAAFLYRQAGSPKFTMPSKGFWDVPASHKFYKSIMWMKATGVSTGNADGSYNPKGTLDRGAMAAFLYRLEGKPPVKISSPFWDVPNGSKFAKEISWMAQNKVSTGNADGSYKRLDPVSRQAMAAFIYRLVDSYK